MTHFIISKVNFVILSDLVGINLQLNIFVNIRETKL